MKTSEMIAMLEKNSGLRFKVKPYSDGELKYDEVCLINGALCWGGNPSYPLRITIGEYNLNWQLVREPVPWQEAIQAVLDGKTVTCECEECTCTNINPSNCIYDLDGDICIKGIKIGTWYIYNDADA